MVSALAWGQAAGGRVTAHVLDLYTGTPASGMRIDFLAVDGGTTKVLKTLTTKSTGVRPRDRC